MLAIRLAALAVVLATATALSTEDRESASFDEAPRALVVYHDLNLANEAGVEILERRIKRAARRMCIDPRERSLAMIQSQQRCFDTAMRNGMTGMQLAIARYRREQLAAAMASAQQQPAPRLAYNFNWR